jgi:endo-1,4-beta-xylanase
MKKIIFPLVVALILSCSTKKAKNAEASISTLALKNVFLNDFYIGAALNGKQILKSAIEENEIISKHFNSITPENILKWSLVHPKPEVYNFQPSDDFVALGQENNMFIVGHTLIWHQQIPDWVFLDENDNYVSREILLKRMEDHIITVAGRYKRKIHGWDVVNEAIEDDGSLRKSKWLEIIGEDYLEMAFEFAYKADPSAELYYNDYNMWKPAKRDRAVQLVKNLQNKGIKVDGIGMQGHYGIDYPTLDLIEESIKAFAGLGVKVMVTELDIDVLPNPSNRQGADIAEKFDLEDGYNPYADSLPESVEQKLNERYAQLFRLFYKYRENISRITFWGVSDHNSWLNNWPIKGRTSYPLLFDRNNKEKAAFQAVINVKMHGENQ